MTTRSPNIGKCWNEPDSYFCLMRGFHSYLRFVSNLQAAKTPVPSSCDIGLSTPGVRVHRDDPYIWG